MGDYTLDVSIDDRWAQQFNQESWTLCFAFGVATGEKSEPEYRIVAVSTDVSPRTAISWSEKYSIAGSSASFMNGGPPLINTLPVDISFGQSYTQPGSWENGSVENDSTAPEAGFKFINETSSGAAVLFKLVDGQRAGIYINGNAPLPQGVETLVPKPTVAVWLEKFTQQGSMMSNLGYYNIIVDMSNNSSRHAGVYFDGSWKNV